MRISTLRTRKYHELSELNTLLTQKVRVGLIITFAEALLSLHNRSYYITYVHPIVPDTNCASEKRQHISECVWKKRMAIHTWKRKLQQTKE